MRLGLIGLGRIGSLHAETLSQLLALTRAVAERVDADIPVFCEKRLSGHVSEAVAAARHVTDRVVPVTSRPPMTSPATAAFTTSTPSGGITGREVVEVYATGSSRGTDFSAEFGDVATAAAVEDAVGGAPIAEAATLSQQQHRPVQIDEVREP